jgi:alanine-glyoxylate transaminase/serine-glyoxylate transaminase/serine-pyruvate transaminase
MTAHMSALLMIPGPIEISEAVTLAYSTPPPSHVAPHVIAAFGRALGNMRRVWLAPEDAVPFVVAGSGTIAMEMAVTNLVEEGDATLLVNTGYFSDRMAEMIARRGARVDQVKADVGDAPSLDDVQRALARGSYRALFATHVDTSTGVRVDAKGLAALAHEYGALSIFDGVCATAGERFEMASWNADVYLTASQKAIGLPAGLALMVVSQRAMARRSELTQPPPLSIDFQAWQPIMQAYEAQRPSYFSTPATNMLLALDVGLQELLDTQHDGREGMEARFALHQRCADDMRRAWSDMGLTLLCKPELAANTLSAIRYPAGVDSSLVKAIAERSVIVAGGLHPSCKTDYFRVGHMGEVTRRPEALAKTRDAIAAALAQARSPQRRS